MDKKKGIADIVFLIDSSGSMQNAIDGLLSCIGTFADTLNDPQLPLKSWRSKIVYFKDFNVDGSDWYVDNPFVSDVSDLKGQLNITVSGGGDEPESLLDALHKLCNSTGDASSQEIDPYAWRPRGSAARVVVIFTDASYHETMSYSEGVGGKVDDVIDLLMQERFFTFLFAPDLACYENLSEVDKCEWEPIPEPFIDGLAALTSDNEKFKEIMIAMAKTITKTASREATEVL